MKYYFAPLEGITGFDFRNVHHTMFKGIDSYFTPFLSARQTLSFVTKEKKDIAPENNIGLTVVPQILANKAPEFVWAAQEIQAHGYSVVNFNLGCPMPTVVTKKKGSGLLADLTHLESLLDDIFDGVANGGPQISIKTRLGFDNLEQACAIVELYNKYPLTELIIHPRSQKDLYKNPVNLDVFEACLTCTKHQICYNGDIFTKTGYEQWTARFPVQKYPQIQAVMLGRGIIANPALCREIQGGKSLTKQELRTYHDTLYQTYEARNYGLSPLLHRMKELWFYWGRLFMDAEKPVRKIRLAKTIEAYRPAVDRLFEGWDIGGHFSS